MACACQKKDDLSPENKTILAAISAIGSPCGSKEIAEKAGLDDKTVSNNLKNLKKCGFIDSPVRCKYAITAAGQSAL